MNKKKLLSGVTALCMSAALLLQPVLAAAPALPEGWKNPFPDVPDNEWFTPFIANLYTNGIINGYDNGNFGPRDKAYAGQAILMAVRAAGSGNLPLQPGDKHWASPYVRYAVEHGWLDAEQVPKDLNGPVSRFFICRLISKALCLQPSPNPSPFADLSHNYITAVYEAGIVSGVRENGKLYFKPDDGLTRDQLSVIIYRVLEYMDSHIRVHNQMVDVIPGLPVFSYDRESFRPEDGRMTCNDEGVRVEQGIDVSKNQGEVNWGRVARDGIDFAIVRVGGRGYGTGVLYEDPFCEVNLTGAKNAGLEVGAYFFSQAVSVREAEEEARYVLERLRGHQIDGPVVFDWEHIRNDEARTDSTEGKTLTAMADAFCRIIREAGYEPMIYMNPDLAYLSYDLAEVAEYPLWISEYKDRPSFRYDMSMWQYSDRGSVDGIQGNVDLNIRLSHK